MNFTRNKKAKFNLSSNHLQLIGDYLPGLSILSGIICIIAGILLHKSFLIILGIIFVLLSVVVIAIILGIITGQIHFRY